MGHDEIKPPEIPELDTSKPVDYEKIIPLLIECIKSQEREITSLKNTTNSMLNEQIKHEKESNANALTQNKRLETLEQTIEKYTAWIDTIHPGAGSNGG